LLTINQLDRIVVVLVGARNPLNIGAGARAMSNFGFRQLRIVNRYQLAFREARSAVGAPELLRAAQECADVAEAIADCSLVVGTTAAESRRIEHPLHRLETGAQSIRVHTATEGRAALLFGSEKRGLSNDDLSYCHWLMRIPTREEHSSMNLGQAIAVCLYELVRTELSPPGTETVPRASGAELARMEQALVDALRLSGYTKSGAEASTEEKVRKLLRRMTLSSEDAETWTGMLAKMQLRPRKDRQS
jgi:TrmH family RNA methyltransferase